jgi:aspartyl-tRNA(Asn)/glutamyl-tRNA(Gln) amidotransferase subunit C
MIIDTKEVENLANLARIDLGEDEKLDLAKDMQGILEYVKAIDKLEVSGSVDEEGAEETSHYNVWREDALDRREFDLGIITGQFPSQKNGFLKVKKIL